MDLPNNLAKLEDEFFAAILENDLEKVTECVANGFTALSKSSSNGDMALHFACLNSKLDVLRILKPTLREGEINTIHIEYDDSICGTALHMTMDGQVDPKVTELLLQWDADPNARDAKGATVLHELIYRAWEDLEEDFRSEECMWEDEETDDVSDDSDSHLSRESCESLQTGSSEVLVGNSYFEKLRLLYKYGVDMNAVNSETQLTPLHFWCQNFHFVMDNYVEKGVPKWCKHFLSILLEFGADLASEDERGDTPMSYMAQRHYKPVHELFMTNYRELLLILIPRISDLTQANMFGRTLLHCAAEFSNQVLVEEVLECDHVNVNAQDKFGLTPLHLIAHFLSKEDSSYVETITDALVKRGCQVNIQDRHGSTPLHHAVQLNNHTAIKCLLKHGASLKIKDNSDRTVVDLGKITGDKEGLELLGLCNAAVLGDNEATTDLRYGWYYPLCCHKRCDETNRGIEEPEIVKDSYTDEWLRRYPICIHNRKAVLQNSIHSLETNTTQAMCAMKDAETMKQEVFELAQKAAVGVGRMNPLFQSRVVFGGSVSEGTKVGSCDEFDLVFDLFRLREHLQVNEETIPGLVKLKVLDQKVFEKCEVQFLIDDEGFLKRSDTSNTFHKLFERALRSEKIWIDSNYFSFWGTTNSAGECYNIGQLNLIWYGPFQKRQDVSVDIAPVISLREWQSKYVNQKVQILDTDTCTAGGCYLVMKDVTRYVEQYEQGPDGQKEIHPNVEKSLFSISFSHTEHAVMRFLPQKLKYGYLIAKSIQLQCPKLTFSVTDIYSDWMSREEVELKKDKDGKYRVIVHVAEILTSYVLKTGLFQDLHDRGVHIPIQASSLVPENWNEAVLRRSETTDVNTDVPSKAEISESITWSLNIYKRLLTLITVHQRIPQYFLPVMDATKVNGGTSSFVKVGEAFLRVMISILESFEIPENIGK